MTAVSYVGAGTRASNTNGNVTPGLPTGLVDGDLLLAWVEVESNVISFTTPPSGWSYLGSVVDTAATTGPSVFFFWKKYATGDVDPLLTKTGSEASKSIVAKCAAWRNADTTTGPTLGTAYNTGATTGTSAGPISGVAVTGAGMALLFAGWGRDYSTAPTLPAGWTLVVNDQAGTVAGNSCSYHTSYKSYTSATSASTTVTGTPVAAAARIGIQVGIHEAIAAAQTVSPPLLSSAPAVQNPTVATAVTLAPPLLPSAPAVQNPTVATVVTLAPPLLPSAPAVQNPAVATVVTVSPDLVASGPALFNPSVSVVTAASPGFLISAPLLFAPTLQAVVTTGPPLLTSGPTLLAPQVTTVVVVAPDGPITVQEIWAPTAVYGEVRLVPDLLESIPQLFKPRGPDAPLVWFKDPISGEWFEAAVTFYSKSGRRWAPADVEIIGAQ